MESSTGGETPTSVPASADPPVTHGDAAPASTRVAGGSAALVPHSPIQHVPAEQPVPGLPIGTDAGLAITRISRTARTPQTLAQAMAQTQTNLAANTGHSMEPADTSLSGAANGPVFDEAQRSALQAAAVLRQAIVSFAGGGGMNLAPSQNHDSSDKASLTASHGGHA
jgi:hypothetical protein